jgi:transcriptional regulator with XRE-family HTH domain
LLPNWLFNQMSKLRDWRKTQGLTQEQLAAQVKSTSTSISRYERGERMPEPEVMRAIVVATGGVVTANDFYALAGEQNAA